ncbi:MAG TPA: protein kinase, partial [Gemmatimonadales bacterium]|nr:protein kinase [Gemmatimonadales bacterium]
MAPTPLERLAPALADRYRIEGELGAGGMATVYLARDLRHDRKVALKVLRPELAAVIGVERFLHEIKTVANLQHPHILPLHDSGEADGLVYYVMPFVEGESLRDRMVREQQLPIDDAVRIAREVADALDYAHRHHVVHRDIKPENILLHDGRAQVADFGIALAASNASGTRMTETGMSLGTPHYMAPEQAMGERLITPKADIYALGCVLYEMLVGEPPFNGPTAQAIIARVMTEEPRPLVTQRHTVTPELEAVVRKALEKTPADRFASAAAFSQALANPGAVPLVTRSTAAASGPGAPRARGNLRFALPFAVGAALLAAVATWAVTRKPAAPLPVARYNVWLPDSLSPNSFVLSPDGSRLAFTRRLGGSAQIWIKERDRLELVPLGTTSASGIVAFSPDSRSLAFVQNSRLMTLPVQGGTPTAIGDSAAGGAAGIAWLEDGTLVYSQSGGATRL